MERGVEGPSNSRYLLLLSIKCKWATNSPSSSPYHPLIPTMPAGPAANDHAMLCALTHKTSIPFGTEYTVCLPQKKQTSRTITAAFGKHFRNRFACHYHFTTNMTLLSAGAGGLVTLSFSAGRLDSIVTRLSVSEGHSISQEQDQVYACYSPHCRNYLSFVVGAV